MEVPPIESIPKELIVEILERCRPDDYVAALRASKLFHPVNIIQYNRKREYHRKQHTFKLGTAIRGPNGSFSFPYTNLLNEPVFFQTPCMFPKKTPQLREEEPMLKLNSTPEIVDFMKTLDGIEKAVIELGQILRE